MVGNRLDFNIRAVGHMKKIRNMARNVLYSAKPLKLNIKANQKRQTYQNMLYNIKSHYYIFQFFFNVTNFLEINLLKGL